MWGFIRLVWTRLGPERNVLVDLHWSDVLLGCWQETLVPSHLCLDLLARACRLAGPPHTVPNTSFSVLRASVSGSSLPDNTTFFTAWITGTGPLVYRLSQFSAFCWWTSASWASWSASTTPSASPIHRPSSESTFTAPPSSFNAFWLPTMRTSRAAPPQPGTRPMCLWTNWITLPDAINLLRKEWRSYAYIMSCQIKYWAFRSFIQLCSVETLPKVTGSSEFCTSP